jgi:hypothetical protein
MKASREGDTIRLALAPGEGVVLRHVLRSLASAYRMPPDGIDPRVAGVWYSDVGCRAAGMSEVEAREWVRQIHGFKSENLERIEGWLGQLGERGSRRMTLELPVDQADAFAGVLNDHRLRVAVEQGIGQEEMDLRDAGAVESLGAERQAALMQIHFLAWMIEVIIRLIAPDAADWGAAGGD